MTLTQASNLPPDSARSHLPHHLLCQCHHACTAPVPAYPTPCHPHPHASEKLMARTYYNMAERLLLGSTAVTLRVLPSLPATATGSVPASARQGWTLVAVSV